MLIIYAKETENNLEKITEVIGDIKRELKSDEVSKEICKEHGFDLDIIDGIVIEFKKDLDASAKTVDSKIQLNYKLLDENFNIIMRYAIHELVHALQHMKLEGIDPYSDKDYLDRDDELEAFQYQITYDHKNRGEKKVEQYVDDLIEYHEISEDEKDEKKEQLMEKIDK